jgi:hypothetical protein
MGVSWLRNCCALKALDLSGTSVTDAGTRGSEIISTLEELSEQVYDLSALPTRPGL